MRNFKDPTQKYLFNPYLGVLDNKMLKELNDGWQGVFRHVILELLPAKKIGEHFDVKLGRPTRELYSMTGLIFMMEAMNWTREFALNAYKYHLDVHYALNLSPAGQKLGMRTFERYIALFQEDELAAKIMDDVVVKLVDILDLNIKEQRLDSTHVFSNMATMGRTRLMKTAIQKFFVQVKRHDKKGFDNIPVELSERYKKNEHKFFACKKDDDKKKRAIRQQVAEDLYFLVSHFANSANHTSRSTYKNMKTILEQQCEIVVSNDEKTKTEIKVREETGGDIIVNPSDPDATFDGHKGEGYQVQLSETCSEDNDVQLITSAIPQTAVVSDSASLEPVLEHLSKQNLSPEEMVADTSYCSDENVTSAAEREVELVGPAPGKYKDSSERKNMNIEDFEVDTKNMLITACPNGEKPIYYKKYTKHNGIDNLAITMDFKKCENCPLENKCPGNFSGSGMITPRIYRIHFLLSQLRLLKRREFEKTDEFKVRYNKRSAIEGTNSGLKQRTGMRKLRVRGAKGVFMAIILKAAGWNILRAATHPKMQKEIHQRAKKAGLGFLLIIMGQILLSETRECKIFEF